ncbi:MAG: NAD(P)-binding domain-containing protein [Lapillicoccus sp.]
MTVDCVVVGAGTAGITTSRALRDAGVEHVVLERGEVGHTWSTQRWDAFALNTPGSMNGLLGDVAPDEYSTRNETVDLLTARAADLPVRTHTPVTAVHDDGDAFRVTTPDDEITARTVVVASGPKNRPLLPALAADLPPHVTALHAAAYRTAAALPEGPVLVVGGGQSGAQIAHDLVRSGRQVFFSTSRVGRYRAHYRGRALLDWHVDSGFWDQTLADLADPASARVATPLIGPDGQDLGLPLLARLGVQLLGRLTSVTGARLGFAGDVEETVRYADEVALDMEQLADDYIAVRRLDVEPAVPDPGRGPVPVTDRPVLDLDAEGIGTVIWCTGFGGDFSWLPPHVLDARGWPLLDTGAAAGIPGLRFVGLPWQTTRSSTILYGLPTDARVAVDGVTGVLRSRGPRPAR